MKWDFYVIWYFIHEAKNPNICFTFFSYQNSAELLWTWTDGGGLQVIVSIHHIDSMKRPQWKFFRFCVFEIGERRERKLNRNEKPLAVQVLSWSASWKSMITVVLTSHVQSHWSSSSSSYQRFVLRRATRSVSNQVIDKIKTKNKQTCCAQSCHRQMQTRKKRFVSNHINDKQTNKHIWLLHSPQMLHKVCSS